MIRRTFEKCGISVPIDSSRDDQINIQGLSYYIVREESSMEMMMKTCLNWKVVQKKTESMCA